MNSEKRPDLDRKLLPYYRIAYVDHRGLLQTKRLPEANYRNRAGIENNPLSEGENQWLTNYQDDHLHLTSQLVSLIQSWGGGGLKVEAATVHRGPAQEAKVNQ